MLQSSYSNPSNTTVTYSDPSPEESARAALLKKEPVPTTAKSARAISLPKFVLSGALPADESTALLTRIQPSTCGTQ
jgi:hypothetical protein